MRLGRGKETLLGEFWELPYDLAREPWREEGWDEARALGKRHSLEVFWNCHMA